MTGGQQVELAGLQRLARLYNIQTSYWDLEGREVVAGAESLLAALHGLGAPLVRAADVKAALHEREHAAWHWRLEPVLVAWDGALDEIDLRVPADGARGMVDIEVTLEGGGTRVAQIAAEETPAGERRTVGGREYIALRLPLGLSLPDGYHRLRLRSGGREIEALVIAAPRRAYAPPRARRWGLFLPLYALHSRRSWGIGDFTDLEALAGWAAGQGAHCVATLPLLASYLETPYEPSPYVPVSRLFWNEIYIDPEAAATALEARLLQDHGVPAVTAEAARRLNAREPVPFREVMSLKRRVLEQLTRLSSQGPAANEAGRSHAATRPAPSDYAAFRAAVERLGPSWRAWPEQQRSGALSAADYDSEAASYFTYAQTEAGRQIAALASKTRDLDLRLYLDLPIGVHPEGYDAWRYQHLFVEGFNVGAPPDLLAREGQNWGFAPLNPEALRSSGYEYARAYLQHHLSAAGILRIDHAIGLHRLFWIPEGASGREGVFVRQPAEEMYAILSLESHRAQAVLVGENLGLVPQEVEEGLATHGVTGMYVQLFEMTGDAAQPVKPPRPGSMASFGTHDVAPFAAYWSDADLAERVRIGVMSRPAAEQIATARAPEKEALTVHLRARGLLDERPEAAEVYRGSTRLLAESDAEWVLLNLEDTWGETRSQNIPGTLAEQHPNWTGRSRYGLEQIEASTDVIGVMEMLRDVRPGAQEETVERG